MKKLVLFGFGLSMLALVSCKKDYTCECEHSGQKYTYDMKQIKKKDAKETCNTLGTTWIAAGGKCDFK